MSIKLLRNISFVLATVSSVSTLQAMDESDLFLDGLRARVSGSRSSAARSSAKQYDKEPNPARSSTVEDSDIITGATLRDHFQGMGLPLTEDYLNTLSQLTFSPTTLKANVEDRAIKGVDGALVYLSLVTSKVFEFNLDKAQDAFFQLEKAKYSSRILPSYVVYFRQQLMFKGIRPYEERYFDQFFSPEKFECSIHLADYFRPRSLVMEVWADLRTIYRDLGRPETNLGSYLAEKEDSGEITYSRASEALVLAHALVDERSGPFSQDYRNKLRLTLEMCIEKLKLKLLGLKIPLGDQELSCGEYIKAISEDVKIWLSPSTPSQPLNKDEGALEAPKGSPKSALKNGEKKKGKRVQFPKDVGEATPYKRVVRVDPASVKIGGLRSYLLTGFAQEIPYDVILQSASQHSSNWDASEELHRRDPWRLEMLLDTPDLAIAKRNEIWNFRATQPTAADERDLEKEPKRIESDDSEEESDDPEKYVFSDSEEEAEGSESDDSEVDD